MTFLRWRVLTSTRFLCLVLMKDNAEKLFSQRYKSQKKSAPISLLHYWVVDIPIPRYSELLQCRIFMLWHQRGIADEFNQRVFFSRIKTAQISALCNRVKDLFLLGVNYLRSAKILSFSSHASRPPAMQEATLISNSIRTTPPPGALRWVGRVLADEAKRPKPGSWDGPAYFDILTLFGSSPFVN